MILGVHPMTPSDAVALATGEGWQIIRTSGRGVYLQRGMRARLIAEHPDGVVVRRAVSPRQVAVAALAGLVVFVAVI